MHLSAMIESIYLQLLYSYRNIMSGDLHIQILVINLHCITLLFIVILPNLY